jgi:midasin (ATPase involved in ribosome maturation)
LPLFLSLFVFGFRRCYQVLKHAQTVCKSLVGLLQLQTGCETEESDSIIPSVLRAQVETFLKRVGQTERALASSDQGITAGMESLFEECKRTLPLLSQWVQNQTPQLQPEVASESEETIARMAEILSLKKRALSMFEWQDGPLTHSMRNGDLILLDEANLAEDAVLERLNSVLEPSRSLTLAEKGGEKVDEVIAHEKWRVFATMNPGGF